MLFIYKDEVLEIHRKLIERFGGARGLRDDGMLESALLAAPNRHYYEQASLAICAATYAFHLTSNRPFVSGNKAIGAAIAEAFLQLNDASLTATNDELVELFERIAAGAVTREDVERAFETWTAPGE